MSSQVANNDATPNTPAAKPPQNTSGRDIIGEVDELFGHADYGEFCRDAMAYLVDLTTARACLIYGADSIGKMVLQGQFQRQGNTLPQGFQPEVDKLATYSRETASSQKVTLSVGDQKLAGLAVPFMGAQGPCVLILLLGPERAPFLEPTYSMLGLYGAVMANYSNRIQLQKTQEAFLQSTLLIDLYTKASLATDYESAVAIVSSELQELVGCDHLALGLERKGRLKLDAISGRKKREKRSQGFTRVQNLMREVRSAESSVVWPPPEDMELKALIASNQDSLLQTFSVGRIIGVPLAPTEGDRKGAMVVMYRDAQQPSPERFELLSSMGPHLVALLTLLHEGLPEGIRGQMRRFARDNSLGKKVAAIVMPLLLIAALFLPVPHHIRAAARLTPDISRQVAAPISGILEDALVKPGEVVQENQLIATLDGKEITAQLAKAIADREVAAKRRDQALAKQDTENYQLAKYEHEALSKEVELLQYRRDNLEIRSPITGLVLTGDLERSKGVPVEMGQKLFEVAAFDKFVTEISVSDEDINWIELDLPTVVRLESRGNRAFETKVEQIYPVSEVSDSENVFVCLAYLVDEDGKAYLRPGMRGRARIEAGWKPLWWILFHKPWNYVKVRFF